MAIFVSTKVAIFILLNRLIKLMIFATLYLTKYMGQLARNYCIIDKWNFLLDPVKFKIEQAIEDEDKNAQC